MQTIHYKDYEIYVFQKTAKKKLITVHHKTIDQFFDTTSIEKATQYIDILMQLNAR